MDPVRAIQSVPNIDRLLDLLRSATRLRISLVARVTDATWECCAVHDDAGFGLQVGDQLEVATTY